MKGQPLQFDKTIVNQNGFFGLINRIINYGIRCSFVKGFRSILVSVKVLTPEGKK